MTLEAQTIARACGKSHVHNLEPEDLVALTVEAAAMAQVPLSGTDWIPGEKTMVEFPFATHRWVYFKKSKRQERHRTLRYGNVNFLTELKSLIVSDDDLVSRYHFGQVSSQFCHLLVVVAVFRLNLPDLPANPKNHRNDGQ